MLNCNISSMRRSVLSLDETPRRELKIHRFKVISFPIMCYIASYGNQYQEIAQCLTEVATCDDEFFLLFATLNKVPKNTTTGLSATFEKLNLNTTSLYN